MVPFNVGIRISLAFSILPVSSKVEITFAANAERGLASALFPAKIF
jgi:hypothetical protein